MEKVHYQGTKSTFIIDFLKKIEFFLTFGSKSVIMIIQDVVCAKYTIDREF